MVIEFLQWGPGFRGWYEGFGERLHGGVVWKAFGGLHDGVPWLRRSDERPGIRETVPGGSGVSQSMFWPEDVHGGNIFSGAVVCKVKHEASCHIRERRNTKIG